MTDAALKALIAAFRKEVEDLNAAVDFRFYFNNGVPYVSTEEVLSLIAAEDRTPYRKVNVLGVDYWFLSNGTLVPYVQSLALVDKSVTPAKMADIASPSFIGRKTAGAGIPEVLTVADVLTLLGLDGISFSDFVVKANGYSLVLNTEIAKIHASGSDNQDLQPINDAITALQNALALISSDSVKNIFDIILPASADVATRCLAPTYLPEGWTVAAGSNPNDLVITHNLGRSIATVTVYSIDGVTDQLLKSGSDYANGGLKATSNNILTIQGFATTVSPVKIHLFFS